jgi:hypothetical protein
MGVSTIFDDLNIQGVDSPADLPPRPVLSLSFFPVINIYNSLVPSPLAGPQKWSRDTRSPGPGYQVRNFVVNFGVLFVMIYDLLINSYLGGAGVRRRVGGGEEGERPLNPLPHFSSLFQPLVPPKNFWNCFQVLVPDKYIRYATQQEA